MGGCCCKDADVEGKKQLQVLFKGSIERWLRSVVAKKPEKAAQVNLAELIHASATALGLIRVEAKTFIDAIVQQTKDPKVIQLWRDFLPRADSVHADIRKTALLRAWLTYDKDNSGDLSLKELETLVESLNFDDSLSKSLLKKTKEKVAFKNGGREPPSGSNSIEPVLSPSEAPLLGKDAQVRFGEFEEAWAEISAFDELAFVWDEVHGNDSAKDITETKLGMFLSQWQHESSFQSEAKRLAAQLNGDLTRDKFLSYLSSPTLNSAIDLVRLNSIYHDMTHPISHYFISASHNSYLTGDQLTSNSSVDCFKIQLLDGCRCVELDCWDGPDPEHPVIYHGYTRTSKISFDETIDTIAKYAWTVSEYPITLSLELHVSHASQEHMVKKFRSAFGDCLAVPHWAGGSFDPNYKISPESHKKKVILKAKRIKGGGENTAAAGAENEMMDEMDDSTGKSEEIKKNMKGAKAHPLAKCLSDMIIMESFHFKSYDNPTVQHFQCNSIVETKSAGMAQSHLAEYATYNNKIISRIYPSGARMDSSNMNPQPHWNAGCQMITMNWQTNTAYEMRFYKGRFADNNNCGYLLKPQCLLSGEGPSVSKPEWWTLEIISGFCLPRPLPGLTSNLDRDIIDPYVKAFIEGPDCDNHKLFMKTEVKNNSGFHPVWKDGPKSKMTFKVPSPELSTMVIQVYDQDNTVDDFLVEAFLPCHLLKQGIRCVPLRNAKSQQLRDTMLMVKLSVSFAPPIANGGIRSATPQKQKTSGTATPPPKQSMTPTNASIQAPTGSSFKTVSGGDDDFSLLTGEILTAPDHPPPMDSELL